jgi:RNA polymerase sigma factor (sigma-70 family)
MNDSSDADSRSAETIVLLRAAAAGNEQAWSDLCQRHYVLLRAVVHHRYRIPRRLRKHFDTDDVIQTTLMHACQNIDAFEHRGKGSFQRWLTKILLNRLTTKVRKHVCEKRDAQREGASVDSQNVAAIDGPDQLAQQAEAQASLLMAIDALDRDDQEIICLRFIDGLSWAAIADELGMGETTARNRAIHAYERLMRSIL